MRQLTDMEVKQFLDGFTSHEKIKNGRIIAMMMERMDVRRELPEGVPATVGIVKLKPVEHILTVKLITPNVEIFNIGRSAAVAAMDVLDNPRMATKNNILGIGKQIEVGSVLLYPTGTEVKVKVRVGYVLESQEYEDKLLHNEKNPVEQMIAELVTDLGDNTMSDAHTVTVRAGLVRELLVHLGAPA